MFIVLQGALKAGPWLYYNVVCDFLQVTLVVESHSLVVISRSWWPTQPTYNKTLSKKKKKMTDPWSDIRGLKWKRKCRSEWSPLTAVICHLRSTTQWNYITEQQGWQKNWVKQQSVATREITTSSLPVNFGFCRLLIVFLLQSNQPSVLEWNENGNRTWRRSERLSKQASVCCSHYIFLPRRGNAVSQMLPPCVISLL